MEDKQKERYILKASEQFQAQKYDLVLELCTRQKCLADSYI